MTKVPTARGDEIETSSLGFTLMAENIFSVTPDMDQNWPDMFGDADKHVRDAIAALHAAKKYGVDTLVDRTVPGIGRNIPLVKRIALESPVNIIVATGFYTWRDVPFRFVFQKDMGDMLQDKRGLEYYFQRDIEDGIGDTGVRAGVIKAATDRYGITEGVELVLRAAAKAHRRTGVPISTHTNGAETALKQLRIFEDEGVDLSRVYLGHIDSTPGTGIDEIVQLIELGATVSFDMLSSADMMGIRQSRIDRLVELCARGYADHIGLSHEQALFSDHIPASDFERFAGMAKYSPWTEVSRDLLPILRERGITDDQITQMTVINPRRVFDSTGLGPY